MSFVNYFVKITGFPYVFPFIKWKVLGKENLADAKSAVIISKHTNFWDVILYQYLFFNKKILFPATISSFGKGKFVDWFFYTLGARPIDNSGNGVGGINQIIEEGQKSLICVFPEGRISSEIEHFHAGAFYMAKEMGRELLPVYIDGRYGLFRRVKVCVGEKFGFVYDENEINLGKTIALAEEKMHELKNIANGGKE